MNPIVLIIILVAVVFLFLAWYVATRNKFVMLQNNVEEGFATIDVYLKKRYDLIPNLLETVKGYMKHEKDTLEGVIKARNLAMTSTGDAKAEAENALSGTLKSLFALSESYPDLKANTQFTELQAQLKVIETELAQSRKYYNAVVKSFNTKIKLFPASIIAGMMKLEKKTYFELDSDEERKNVKVSFN